MQDAKIFLTQYERMVRSPDWRNGSPDKSEVYFVVTKLINTVNYKIGQELQKLEIQDLLYGSTTVTITGQEESRP